MESENKTYNKTEIAIKLTNQAIKMFFHKEDDISIHLLASAANEILTKLMDKHKLHSLLGNNSLKIKPEFRKEWINGRKKAYNFSKHADRDINEIITFNPQINILLILENINFFKLLKIKHSNEMIYFVMWLLKTQKQLFADNLRVNDFFKTQTMTSEDFFTCFDDGMKIIELVDSDKLQNLFIPV